MTRRYERVVKMVLIFAVAAGAALVVLSELYPDEEEGNVCGQACVAGLGR
ncbi:MAG: hypothetical protein WC328_15130 [Kiritimatiellia bacterium]|jgi:hypothetical protein|nr:hypothetical protein [Kiritimatiellia bacterium]MDD4442992.1 hypothetical protein [Kiritimatiellia bacterium]MDX9794684.1 hypothetical protein [Kiritimatiellia bacterium]